MKRIDMSTNNIFEWVDAYKKFARNLLKYKNERGKLISEIKSAFNKHEIRLPKLDRDEESLVDIDPFTLFGLFNKNSMKEENRIKIFLALATELNLSDENPKSFNGIPVLNSQNATYYHFVGDPVRKDEDFDELWSLFECGLAYADNPSSENKEKISDHFDYCINIRGNGNSKITMGLYWIAPEVFLNLDSRNEWYIYESGKVPENVVASLPEIEPKIPAKKYFDIVEKVTTYLRSNATELKDYNELSFEAWRYSEEINEKIREEKKKQNEDITDALADSDIEKKRYWLYSPDKNASKWYEYYEKGIMGIGWGAIGDLSKYDSKEEMKQAMKEKFDASKSYNMAALATWQFANVLKPGDIIFVKKGMYKIVGRGIVESDYEYIPNEENDFANIRKVKWTDKGEWDHPGQAAMKTLTDITRYTDYVEQLSALFDDEIEEIEAVEKTYPKYTEEKFLEEVYMDEDSYYTLVELIREKKNVILQGAPGVGKTFAAKRLAYSMIGSKNQDRVMMVQFHQSYSYEDFIEGLRPSKTGMNFDIKRGAFLDFCDNARDDLENEYFFIIDEINRGNLSKIFGELFMLIENDKRGNELQLLYSGDKFSVPKNVYIIGMMNTADRSLALLDYALRRRFAFYEMRPGFNKEGFKAYRDSLNNPKFNKLIQCVERLNERIKEDNSLGEGFCIGHSYFCDKKNVTDKKLSNIVEFELIPLLKEYWFDDNSKVIEWSDALRSSIK